mmetsp:Transcript_14997/g.25642  ORF Transcript_14997/g.25642 Transcript_14997/m.25642 type:complete len:284 (-) Transcript_14997:438-1289(-)|eukprot:CAMPEP_0196658970 /NCGR_PEP_ID=MMETSP1086-20130531/32529_1 /TAXON_ID=77921 /ORGANISM="Cyanoptyche  gloeocystis , Strain SAG4.97" /LENGTH=283 /DNA_ID=CAMNT_0041992771 /DNA_START=122 /DNA_END=973 /DNA_ORIENTATION=-
MAPRADFVSECHGDETELPPEKPQAIAPRKIHVTRGYPVSSIPVSALAMAVATFTITFSLAFAYDHVQTPFPFLSLTGNRAPESHFFGFGLTVVGILISSGGLFIHEYLEFHLSNDYKYEIYVSSYKKINRLAQWTMMAGGMFLALLATVPLQENAEDLFLQKAAGLAWTSVVHTLCAVSFFTFSYIHAALSLYLFAARYRRLNTSLTAKLACFTSATLFAILCPFLSQGAVGVVSTQQHVTLAPVTQYGLVASVTLYYVSYYFDVRGLRFGLKIHSGQLDRR